MSPVSAGPVVKRCECARCPGHLCYWREPHHSYCVGCDGLERVEDLSLDPNFVPASSEPRQPKPFPVGPERKP